VASCRSSREIRRAAPATKSPAPGPGFSSRRLLAPPLARIQRETGRVRLLPHRALGALELAADAPRRRLLPRHRPERLQIALGPITANSSPGTCHFHRLHLVGDKFLYHGTWRKSVTINKSCNMREKFLIYAQIVFWVLRAIFDGIFVSATSRREPFGDQRQDSCFWSKRPEIAHDSSTFCAPAKDKSGTCVQTFRFAEAARLRVSPALGCFG